MASLPPRRSADELVVFAARLVRLVRRLSPPDESPALIRLLSLLDEIGPSTVGALAEADRTAQPTTTAAVKSLVARGWASRRSHPHDARASIIELTEAGRAQLAETRSAYGAVVASRLPPYGEDDLDQAVGLLAHLLEGATSPAIDHHTERKKHS